MLLSGMGGHVTVNTATLLPSVCRAADVEEGIMVNVYYLNLRRRRGLEEIILRSRVLLVTINNNLVFWPNDSIGWLRISRQAIVTGEVWSTRKYRTAVPPHQHVS